MKNEVKKQWQWKVLYLGLHGKKIDGGTTYYQVKWENYKEKTWEPQKNIPQFIIDYFERTGNNNIPQARIKNTKVIGKLMMKRNQLCKLLSKGGSKYHLLVWDDKECEMFWEEEPAMHLDSLISETYTCNTQKDKDKRICRHTFGVIFGCSPCGVGL